MIALTPVEILDAHPDISVLTLDFFDTLVTRSVAQPTHVFAVMEERLARLKGDEWQGFALRRVLAERSARHERFSIDEHSDVTLDDVMRHLAVDLRISPAQRDELAALEQETEIELTQEVPWGRSLLEEARRRGLRVLIVSDNYMPSAHLVRVAQKAGLTIDAHDVIVSCECGAMKHDGSIWPSVLEVAGVPPTEILHVGDLEDADGCLPARQGIRTHVNPAMRVSHREPLNTAPAILPLSRVEARNRSAGVVDPVLNLATGALAIIVAGQVLDVIRRSEEVAVQGIHFTARDGYLAHQTYSRVREARTDLPRHSYTEISRSITWRASLGSVDSDSVRRFVGDDEVMTVARLRNRFGCDLSTELDERAPLDADAARAVVLANAATVQAACMGVRSRLLEHLVARGVTEPGHHLLMDLGWSGSVVADLARILRETNGDSSTYEGRLTALYWDATSNRRKVNLHGLATDEFAPVDDNVRLLGTIRYFEALLTAPHGSVVDYRDGSAVHGLPDVPPEIPGSTWHLFEESVVSAAASIVLGTHELVRPGDVTGGTVWAAMMQAANTPTDAEVAALGSMRHDTAIDHSGEGQLLVAPPPSGFATEKVDELYGHLMRNHWLQGSLAAWSTEPSHRWIADEVRRHMPPIAPQWVAL